MKLLFAAFLSAAALVAGLGTAGAQSSATAGGQVSSQVSRNQTRQIEEAIRRTEQQQRQAERERRRRAEALERQRQQQPAEIPAPQAPAPIR